MPNEVVLSASSVTTFLRCGQQWYFAYVMELKRPPTVRQLLGTAAHSAIELNMLQKVDTKTDLAEALVLDAFSDAYDAVVPEVEDPEEDPAKAKDSGIGLLRLHHREVAPKIQPVLVEEPVQFRVNGHPFSGVVDLVDDRDRIRDWKTTRRRPTNESYMLNMTGYALGYRQATGKQESEVVLDYLVRTKVPSYVPIPSGGPISKTAVVQFASIVGQVADAISAGTFMPNGLINNACSWCGYQSICPAYNGRKVR
jgi:RecB family exonuclease